MFGSGWRGVGLLTVMALAASCPSAAAAASAPAAKLGYVGKIKGSRAYVGIVVRAGEATAYVCDGRKLARWLSGPVRRGRARLRGDGGARLKLRLAGKARGVLRLRGRPARRFVAERARGRAGLFRRERPPGLTASARGVLTGWVRLNDGSIRGASRTSTPRVVRPAPGVEVVLRADSSTVGPPGGAPSLDVRLTGAAAPLCEAVQGRDPDGRPISLALPGCGLPRAGVRPPARPGTVVLSRPDGFRLSADSLLRFAAGIGSRMAQERARLFGLARQKEPGFPVNVRSAADVQAQLMLHDPKLLEAAERLRRARTADAQAAIDEYRQLFRPYRDKVEPLLGAGWEAFAVRTPAIGRRERPFRVVRSFRGPWAESSTVNAEGDEWATSDEPLLGGFAVLGEATDMLVHARAGFDSRVDYRKTHLLAFDVPANAGQVEVEIRNLLFKHARLDDCFGSATGFVDAGYLIFDVGADGSVDPATETPVAGGFDITFTDYITQRAVCGLAPPIPQPAPLQGPDDVITFTPPAQGGLYLLGVSAGATAEVVLGGSAASEMNVVVQEVVVRHDG